MMKLKSKFFPFSSIAVTAAITSIAATGPAFACGDGAYISQICIMAAASYCPINTVELNGQTIAISGNEALYSLMGCTYGGDCRTNFNVPDFRGRVPVGYGQGPGLSAHIVGEKWGTEIHSLSMAELASHTHQATFTPDAGGTTGGTGGGTASGEVEIPVSGAVKLGASAPASKTNQMAQKGVLVQPSASGTAIYGPAGTSADVQIGPDNAVTGVAKGNISLTVSGGGGGSSGTVAVDPTGSGRAFPVSQPSIAMRYCLVTAGLYPPRP